MNRLYNTEEIKRLLDKYFDGETCSKEENVLRSYFSENQVNEELKAEQEYFLALSQLKQKAKQPYLERENRQEHYPKRRFFSRFIPLSAAAAIAGLIVVSVFHFYSNNADYLIVNGVKTNDKAQMEVMFYASLESAKIDMDDIWETLKD